MSHKFPFFAGYNNERFVVMRYDGTQHHHCGTSQDDDPGGPIRGRQLFSPPMRRWDVTIIRARIRVIASFQINGSQNIQQGLETFF